MKKIGLLFSNVIKLFNDIHIYSLYIYILFIYIYKSNTSKTYMSHSGYYRRIINSQDHTKRK